VGSIPSFQGSLKNLQFLIQKMKKRKIAFIEFSKLSEAGADLMTKEGVKYGHLGCLVDSES
jgi:hypothetical protein